MEDGTLETSLFIQKLACAHALQPPLYPGNLVLIQDSESFLIPLYGCGAPLQNYFQLFYHVSVRENDF